MKPLGLILSIAPNDVEMVMPQLTSNQVLSPWTKAESVREIHKGDVLSDGFTDKPSKRTQAPCCCDV